MNKILLNFNVFCDCFPDRAINIAYCPWAIRENPALPTANQIAPFAKTNACHIVVKPNISNINFDQ
jgi:hypothetical protein